MMFEPYVFAPFEKPELTLAQEFENHMAMAVAESCLGSFTGDLWGMAITTDLESETVDCHLWFGVDPTVHDRYEMSYWVSSFGAATGGGIGLNLHRTVMSRSDYSRVDTSMRWLYLQRNPTHALPDDMAPDDLHP